MRNPHGSQGRANSEAQKDKVADLMVARMLDTDWGWEQLFDPAFNNNFLLSLLASEGGSIFKQNCHILINRYIQ